MNSDIRIKTTLPTNPKIRKLIKRLGPSAPWALIQLWIFAALHKPDGILNNMDFEDIEDAVLWDGKPGAFVDELINLGFIVLDSTIYTIKNWKEHNAYANGNTERSTDAKRGLFKRWAKKRMDKKELEGFEKWLINSYVVDFNHDTNDVIALYRGLGSTPIVPLPTPDNHIPDNHIPSPYNKKEKKTLTPKEKKVKQGLDEISRTKRLNAEMKSDEKFKILWSMFSDIGKSRNKGDTFELWKSVIEEYEPDGIIYSLERFLFEQKKTQPKTEFWKTSYYWFKHSKFDNHYQEWVGDQEDARIERDRVETSQKANKYKEGDVIPF